MNPIEIQQGLKYRSEHGNETAGYYYALLAAASEQDKQAIIDEMAHMAKRYCDEFVACVHFIEEALKKSNRKKVGAQRLRLVKS